MIFIGFELKISLSSLVEVVLLLSQLFCLYLYWKAQVATHKLSFGHSHNTNASAMSHSLLPKIFADMLPSQAALRVVWSFLDRNLPQKASQISRPLFQQFNVCQPMLKPFN